MSSNDNSSNTNDNSQNRTSIFQNKIELLLALTRTVTIICTFFYLVPVLGRNAQSSCYQKALLANAATSALRLHQRIPNFALNLSFFNILINEDSAHYLLFSIIFIFNKQFTMVLLPIFLFALLHLLSFVLRVLRETNRQGSIYSLILNFVEKNKINMFQLIALSEIAIMPFCVLAGLGDLSKLFIIFFYYRFLKLRYLSRRNPYCKAMFTDLKNTTMRTVNNPQCPVFIRNVAYKCISLISSLAPPMQN